MKDRVWFQTPTGPVATVRPDAALLLAFQAQAPDWPWHDAGPADSPEMTIRQEGETGYRFLSPNYDAPDFVFPPGLIAGNGLIGCLIHTFVASASEWICLHAGAVAIDDGLTVLLGDTMSGKSTMSVALMALGHQLWTDDRLPVLATSAHADGDTGMALALRPKLRMPLPPNAPDDFRSFVSAHQGESEGEMRYICPPPDGAAGFDARLAVKRLIVLNRAHDVDLELREASLGETVKRLVTTCFAPHLGTVGLLARCRALAEATDCLSLTYADSFEAAAMLSKAFRS